MTNADYEHDQAVVVDLVHDAVVASPYSVGAERLSGHGLTGRRTGITREQIDHRLDSTPSTDVEASQLT
jgi:hypothetical protein